MLFNDQSIKIKNPEQHSTVKRREAEGIWLREMSRRAPVNQQRRNNIFIAFEISNRLKSLSCEKEEKKGLTSPQPRCLDEPLFEIDIKILYWKI